MTKSAARLRLPKIQVRDCLDPTSYQLVLPLLAASTITSLATSEKPSLGLLRLETEIIAFGLAIGLLLCFGLLLRMRKPRDSVSIVAAALLGGLIGLVKSLCGVFLFSVASKQHANSGGYLSIAVVTTALSALLFPLLILLNQKIRDFKSLRSSYLFEISNQELIQGKSNLRTKGTPKYLDKFIAESKTRLLQASTLEKTGALGEISSIINQQIRPSSHRLWRENAKKITSFSVRELLNYCVQDFSFRLEIITPIYLISVVNVITSRQGVNNTVLILLLHSSITICLFLLAKRIPVKTNAQAWLRFSLLQIAISTLGILSALALVPLRPIQNPFISTTVNFVWLSGISLFIGSITHAFESDIENKKRLIELVSTRESAPQLNPALLEIENRKVANYLHSELQNKFLQSALKISQAQPDQENDVLAFEVKRLMQTLDGLPAVLDSNRNISPLEQIKKIENDWHGLIALSYVESQFLALEPLMKVSPLSIFSVTEVISEAVANAYRHGHADQIEIDLEVSAGLCTLTASDNGVGKTIGKIGLGSTLFDETSQGNWSFDARAAGGGKLVITIPIKNLGVVETKKDA
jgi:hypothetical protein